MKLIFALSLSLCVSLVSAMSLAQSDISAQNFRQVQNGLYRSGRPSMADYDKFKAMGIKIIIDVENDSSAIEEERAKAAELNIEFISLQMNPWLTPNDRDVDQMLALLQEQKNYPILIHCQHGEDRTGLIIGLFRVFVDGWAPDKAYQEMLDLGFHKIFGEMTRYFHSKTNS